MTPGDIIEEAKEEVQMFDKREVRDGYEEDDQSEEDISAVSALRCFNWIGRDLARAGLIHKYINFTLPEGEIELCPNTVFRFVYEVRRIDSDTQNEILTPFTRARDGQENAFRHSSNRRGRVRQFGFLGKYMYFDIYANVDTEIELLAETGWTDTTSADDPIDTGINVMDHDIFIAGTAWRMARKARNNPANRNEFFLAGLMELQNEYFAMKQGAIELNKSRYTQGTMPPMIETYGTERMY